MLLAKLLAGLYFLFGVFGLVVVSVRGNYGELFHVPGRPVVGLGRLALAYLVLLLMVACGISPWLLPDHTSALAALVLVFLVIGKILALATGSRIHCLICLVLGTAASLLLTWALIATSHQLPLA
jgi:hypothetical protein